MMEGREKTKEELDEENRIEDEQEKLIEENKNDLEFLHKKAEEIFYSDAYSEGAWDSLFRLVTMYIEDHHNPASLPVLLRLCDDDRFYDSCFRDGWLNIFFWGYEKEDLCREYFTHLHELFSKAPEMGASIYDYAIGEIDIELQKKYLLSAKPEALNQLFHVFLEPEYVGWFPLESCDEQVEISQEQLNILKQYYDAHRLQVV